MTPNFRSPPCLHGGSSKPIGSKDTTGWQAAARAGIWCYVRSVLALTIATLGLVGCQVSGLPPPPPDAPKLTVFKGEPPTLEPTDAPGLFAAPSLGPTVYYSEEQAYWFRFGKNRWYMAFAWDGNWFALSAKEVPAALAVRHAAPAPQEVEDELAELDRQLKEIERKQAEQP